MGSATIIDVNEMRMFDIQMNGLTGLDEVYTFYYDETNNIRRLHVRPDGLNVKELKCFVLGGIVHRGDARDLDFASLRNALHLQPTTQDLKLEHVAKGDFLDVLGKPKLTTYLEWVLARDLFVHYFVLDPLYWAVLDIIESILANAQQFAQFHVQLKNDLYHLFRYDHDKTVDLFQRYSFPDVPGELRGQLIAELLAWLEAADELMPHFNYMMLKGTLQMGAKMDRLAFIEGETPNVLIDQFSTFYIKRFCLFKASAHIADAEDVIKDLVEPYTFVDNGKAIRNFRFVRSHNEQGVQISDVIVGVLGKLFSFINSTISEELVQHRQNLSTVQRRNLDLLKTLLDHSIGENEAFAQFVISAEDRRRAYFLLEA